MNYTQNQKIKQVKKETLVVGVDITKKDHVAQALEDYRGRGFKIVNLSPIISLTI